ncbi:zonadhesin-like isoform X2 [Aricia agestis]|uniref:zonadhesin-like isoform X2 n=1 Tax=Aricia agestis TaxID=91739 RepID=UPI001C206AA8|nr:zonadhesin-like isoform X2 [Aricia agestis]
MFSAKMWIVFVLTAVNVYVESSEEVTLYCRPDEELYGCINAPCGRWECSQPESGICVDVVPGGCIPGCKCKEPLLRTDDGRCVPASQCPPPKCRGPNEFFMCGPACDNVCSELNIRNQTHCDILNIQCNPMCYCIEGHARDANGICIPIEHCPAQICGENEEYTPSGICQARTCDDLGYPLPCYNPNSGITINQGPGCVCKPGYVRDCNGKCIPNSQCPSCGGDPNATSGCSTFCTTCDNYGQEVVCIQSCILNGCACKDGYIYDIANKKCVLPQNCPAKTCNKPNEILGCKNACPVRTCASTRYKQLYKCPPPPKDCEQGCVCAPDFFRNSNGDCVPRDQCFPNITCRTDEEYNSCANGGCGRWLCSQPSSICIDPVKGGCVPGCRCKAPLLRTSDGRCVPGNQCPQPQCGINEEFVQCKDSVCRPQTCGDLGFPLGCLQAIANNNEGKTCQQGPGCVCKEGFVRDSNGNCISAEQCPSCGGDPNATTGCGTFCTTCDNYGQEAFCILPCQLNGCACRNGYIYDTVNKKCVLPQNCPPKQLCTKPNEISGCNNTCSPRTCEAKDRIYECPLSPLTPQPCVQTCICAPGFYRNAAGDCVTKDQCLPLNCRPDEELYGCINAPCGRWECSQPESGICVDVVPGGCIPGCKCKEPLLRTDDGRCVPASQCPPLQCGKNEEYVQCKDSVCRPQACGDLGFPLGCLQAIADNNQSQTCQQGPGCVCKEGFVRDSNGNCISAEQCPSCGGDPNATTGCSTFCTTCDNYGQEAFCILSCQLNGCACKDGYIYDTVNKKCVLPKNCSKKCNKPNEITGCKNACPPRTCEAKDREYKCRPRPQFCEPDCVCAPGFYRNAGGNCVTKEQCDQCSGPNEFFSCGGACDNVCSELSIRNQTKCDIINIKCNDKCYCLEGFARDAKGICIPIKKCPNPVQCGDNAEFVTEPVCRPETCSDLGFPLPCLDPESGITASHGPGCVCKVGFVRDNNGKCVSEKRCPSCGGDPNATTGCGTFCETCDNYGQNAPCIFICRSNSCACKNGYIYDTLNKKCVLPQNCPAKCNKPNEEWGCQNACPPRVCESIGKNIKCPIVAQVCIPACNCKRGFFRNRSGDCVSKQQCLEPPKCGKNEVYAKAVSCPPQTCLSRLALINCPPQNATSIAKYECRCKPGFLRNEIDECIPADKCSSCNGKNEIYARSVSCPPQTCISITARYICSEFKPPTTEFECRCRPGFFRNKINECISTEECGKCTGPNEYYSCGPACDNVCSELSIRNQTNCDIINIKCNGKCYCIKGYARDANGICVPIKDCPPQCGRNQEYVECPDAVCRPKTCDQVGLPVACPDLSTGLSCQSKPGCICSEGYVQHQNGTCIPYSACPSCGGDANAVSGCGVYCNTKCTGNTKICRKICEFNSCDCKPGFLLDTVLNACVLPDKCTCGPNEVFSKCTNRACHRSNCAQLSIPWVCRALATPSSSDESCVPGCECVPGYLRNSNGDCIPQNQCPEAKNQTGSNTNGDVNAAAQLENGNGVFTSRFLYEAAKNNPGQSVVASPLSVLFLLAQLALFATGVALEQLNALLNLNSPQQIRGTIPPYLISFNSEKNITLRLAERVYGSEKYPFSESFKEVTRNVFLAEAQNLDFSNPKDAAKSINDWIASQTNNLIQNLVPENSLNADTRLVLTNAIYMRANFSKPFNIKNTQPRDFHVSDTKTVTVRMMNQVSRFRYGVMPKSQAQVVELPYQNENASLLILLPPKTADGMDNLLEEQLGFASITAVLSNLSYKKLDLSLPSFGTETRTDLKDILEKAGVKQIFKSDSGLSGIFAKPENVSVSYASQLAKITVDEFGAEAAAGNAIVVGVTSVGVIEDPIDFNADRSFLYYLLLRGNPLFCGRYAGPQ